MNRRRLLIGMAAATVGGTIVAASRWTAFDRFADRALIQYLRLRCEYLKLEINDDEFDRFVRLYRKHYGRSDARWSPGGLESMTAVFLMSTDFIENGCDESMPVRFRRFFHAYVSPCWNPLVKRGERLAGGHG